jgi:hypothetical protein
MGASDRSLPASPDESRGAAALPIHACSRSAAFSSGSSVLRAFWSGQPRASSEPCASSRTVSYELSRPWGFLRYSDRSRNHIASDRASIQGHLTDAKDRRAGNLMAKLDRAWSARARPAGSMGTTRRAGERLRPAAPNEPQGRQGHGPAGPERAPARRREAAIAQDGGQYGTLLMPRPLELWRVVVCQPPTV